MVPFPVKSLPYALTPVTFQGRCPTVDELRTALVRLTGLAVDEEAQSRDGPLVLHLHTGTRDARVYFQMEEGRILVDLNDVHPYVRDAVLLALVDRKGQTTARVPVGPLKPWAQTPQWRYTMQMTMRRLAAPVVVPLAVAVEILLVLPATLVARAAVALRRDRETRD